MAKTKAQQARQNRVRDIGCIVCLIAGYHDTPAAIHHCETGAGGRKDEDKVLPLCHEHHQGKRGIHTLSRGVWAIYYGTEQYLMDYVAWLLGERKSKPDNGGIL
jgi:hypothetical protein